MKRLSDRKQQSHSLSSSQADLWIEHQLYAPDSYNHFHFVAKIRDIDIPRFKRAFKTLLSRHETFRTYYPNVSSSPYRKILSKSCCVLSIEHVLDLSSEELERKLMASYEKGFHLESSPPFRFVLYQTSKNEFLLQIVAHHIAVSLDGFYKIPVELAKLYSKEKLLEEEKLDSPFLQEISQMVQKGARWADDFSHPPPPQLPGTKKKGKNQNFSLGTCHFDLNPTLVSNLKEVRSEYSVSFFSLLTAAFQILLSKYTDVEECIVGIPTDLQKDFSRKKAFIGYATNTLPIRTRLEAEARVGEVLQKVHSQMRRLSENRVFPLSELLRRAKVSNVHDLFSTLVVSHKLQENENLLLFGLEREGEIVEIGDLQFESIGLGAIPTGRFDLTLALAKTKNGYCLTFRYNREIYQLEAIRQLADSLLSILGVISETPEARLNSISAISQEEERLQLETWNQTAADFSGNYLESFEAACTKKPDAVALIFQKKQLTFQELNTKANEIAHWLVEKGNSGETVALLLDRSPEFVYSMLGILKAGCSFLPIDPALPQKRIAFILQDSAAKLLITDEKLRAKRVGFSGEMVFLDRLSGQRASFNPQTEIRSDSLAYLIYTSGSTGKPKGVEISHTSLSNFLFSMKKELKFTSHERWLALTTFSFDISILEILLPLISGSTLVLADQEERKDPLLLKKAIKKHKITFAQATPSTWQMLLEMGWEGSSDLTLLCGGEPLPEMLAKKLPAKCKILWNMYGPTETTIWSSMKEVKRGTELVTIGKPIANTRFYVLDKNQKLVPIGTVGELYIGGEGVARGYRNRNLLTVERFQTVKLPGNRKERLYKTGDLVRYLPNGEIEYVGRTDTQVKIRGHRIELEEIEKAIKKTPRVENAIVVAKGGELGKTLVAYYSGKGNREEIHSELESQLPSYMLPSSYIPIDRFPLNANGKVDRGALSKIQGTAEERVIHPLTTKIEKQLGEIFQKALSLEEVGRNTDFFNEGGHSLLAVQVILKIKKVFQVELPFSIFFRKRTIGELADHLEKTALKTPTLPSSKSQPSEVFPLSYPQNHFWFLSRAEDSNASYSIPFLIEFKGNLHISTLRKVLKYLVNRHESLRAYFEEDASGPKQRFSEGIDVRIPLLHVESVEEGRKRCKEESKKPFDLKKAPLFRFKIFKIEENFYMLFLNFHHIIFDGYSQNIFLKELKLLYEGFLNMESFTLEALPSRYSEFILREKSIKYPPEKIDWWKKSLQDASNLLLLPTDRSRSMEGRSEGRIHQFSLSKKDSLALRQLAQTEHSTLFSLLATIFYTLLFRYTGQEDITIGIPTANRYEAEFSSLIGCFTNTLPMRVPGSLDKKFSSLLSAIQSKILEMIDHELPFEKLITNLKFARSLHHSPLFQTMFNLLPKQEVADIDNAQISMREVDKKRAHLDLSLTFQETPDGFAGVFEYRSDLFLKKTISRMAGHFIHLTKEILKNPHLKIDQFQMLSPREVKKETLEWNRQEISYDPKSSILKEFAKWVEATPDGVAIFCGGERYTYQEVDHQANQIANALISAGVQKEDPIPICLERSAEFIVGILGILKSGAAYVPIDPQEPKKRVCDKLQSLDPLVILTRQKFRKQFSSFKTLYLDELSDFSPRSPDIEISPNQLAYIIFTSGTSGEPKGVEIEHRSITDRVMWKCAAYPLSPEDRILHTYSLIFDGAIINYFWPLCCGSTLVLTTNSEQIDSQALVSLIQEHQIVSMDMLPTLLEALLDEIEFSSCRSLRDVFVGGEPLKSEVIHRFYQMSSAALHNTYGPTEATVEAANWKCDPSLKDPVAPLGQPIGGAKVYVLDRSLNLVPPGVVGELFIGGVGVARGYHHDHSLTKSKFLPNPFDEDSNERIYATGDLAKYQPDGCLEFLGRIDDQVKIRGYRIDTKEIESRLLHIDPVDRAVVLTTGEGASAQLVAYVVLTPPMSALHFEPLMRNYMKQFLPYYMIPAQVVVMNEFPTLLNGKLDYKKFPPPPLKRRIRKSAHKERIQTPFFEKLSQIWKEILQMEEIDPDENFFDMGGNSLSAMRLVTKIKYEMGKIVPITTLFRFPTLRELAISMEEKSPKLAWSPLVPIQSKGTGKPFFCVHPIGGSVICYKALAKQVKTDRPFYGLQARGLEESQTPHHSIHDMAKEYIQAIKERQPRGPYLLGGWSFGGIVAIEMAHQLIAQGEEVAKIILLDSTAAIEKFKKLPIDDDSKLLQELLDQYSIDLSPRSSPLPLKEQFVRFIQNGNCEETNTEKNLSDRILTLAKAHYNALKSYKIPSIPVEAALLRAEHNPETAVDLGWKKHVKKISIHTNPGNHWAITREEHAYFWAKDLEDLFRSPRKKSPKKPRKARAV